MSTLEQRIRRLEVQNRFLLAGLLLPILGALLLAATGKDEVPDVVKARAFQVVGNDRGAVLVHIGSTTTGEGMVTTLNRNGQDVVTLGANPHGGVVTTWNGKGQKLVMLDVTTDGGGMVRTGNGKGEWLVYLGERPHGGGLRITNDKGRTLVRLGARIDGPGVVTTYDPRRLEGGGVFTTRP